ncbi:hypothetical protein [Streptomyces sp. NPDC048425]|uniref:hypothetical protein n=1 Tax=Streptomyces sp. NPDC048425 TaxID=3365548 RepID=UPI00371D24C3
MLQKVLVQLADEGGQILAAADLIIWSERHGGKYPVVCRTALPGGWLRAVLSRDHAAEVGTGSGEGVFKLCDLLFESLTCG